MIKPLSLLALFSVALSGCGGASPPQTSGGETVQSESRPAGHRRILELLRRIADDERAANPYLGEGPRNEIAQQLAALPEGVPDLRRWLYHKLIGLHDLRLGRNQEAIEHYLASYRELERFRSEIPPAEAAKTAFEIGVAYMRLGEAQNCALRHNRDSCIMPIRGAGVHVDLEGSTEAIRYFEEVLSGPDAGLRLKARWLINIAYMTLGRYPDQVPAALLVPPELLGSADGFPRFLNVAPELGLDRFDLAGGAVVEDFDGDDLLDVMVSTSDTSGQMQLFRNTGDGAFRNVTREAALDGLLGGLNMVHADYDNDGDADVLVLRGGWWRTHGRHPNSLLRNEGDGRFVDVTFEAGLGAVHYPTQTAAWADYDNDGDLDLYIGNEHGRELDAPGQLFRNESDGTFRDVAANAGVENRRFAKGVVWGDYDGDRFPDLYISNLNGENRLYHNDGDGTFRDVAPELGVTGPIASFPLWFWDYNNDGALDLFVAAYGGPQLPHDVASVAASYLGLPSRAELPQLYRGDGRGGFSPVGDAMGLDRVSLPMGSNFGDLDNDGFPDFYLGTGYPYYEALMPNLMYQNREGARFDDVTVAGGFGHLQKGHAVVFADLDNDGDQDLFEQLGGAYPGDAFGNALFENPGFGNGWIKILLRGTRSNRSGIGARIRLELKDRGQTREIFRTVNTGGSFGSNPLRQEIGLGGAIRIERLEVYWPTSDTTQRFETVEAGQLIRITEGRDELETIPLTPVSF